MSFEKGLQAAAAFLEATASDYNQMAGNMERGIGRLNVDAYRIRLAQVEAMHEKARLLRGQADIILRLKERDYPQEI